MNINIFDAYNLRARTSVILFYTLPFAFDAFSFVGNKISAVEGIILTLLIIVFMQCTLHLCRPKRMHFNTNIAAELLMPQSSLSGITRMRYYRKLASLEPDFSGFGRVDKNEEAEESITLELCESTVAWLRARTRDNKVFRRVFEENINYGFLRNMHNMKKQGIIINALAMVLLAVVSFTPIIKNYKPANLVLALEIAVHIMATLYLITAITKEKVEAAAKQYAYALIESIDQLG